jgi:tetratricopeptide (TPR) repeat protein
VPRFSLSVCSALFASLLLAQSPEALFREGVDAQQHGDFSTAIRDYQKVLQFQPNLLSARVNLGAALAHIGRFDDAIREYRSALEQDSTNYDIRLNLALALYKKGDCQSAASEFEQLHQAKSHDLRVVTLLGDCELRLGHASEAVQLTVPAAQSQPDNLDLAFVAGSALIKTGKRRDGLVFLDRVAKHGNSADAYLLAGSTWLDINEFEAARQNLEQALKLNPDLPGAHTLLGVALDKSGDQKDALPEFKTALSANPNDFQANLYMGAILYKQRDMPSAHSYLEKALALDSSSAMARYEFALVESASGDYERAAADMESAARSDPNWLEPHVELAALYYKLHRPQDGARQRAIVDRLTAEQQKRGPQ